jgi:diguanylate cyclase (GGDEF)-like protein
MSEVFAFRRVFPSIGFSADLVRGEDEASRAQMLESYGILDSAAEKPYDDIARLAALICGTQTALIAFFDHDRLWIKARYGNAACSGKSKNFPNNAPFCEAALQEPDQVTLVPDMTRDPRFADHPLTAGPAKMRFYAAAPLTDPAGMVLGMLCVLDRRSRTLTTNQTNALETLGRQVMELLEMRRRLIGLSEANARLGQQSLTDALTAIPNRRAYDQKLTEEYARAKRSNAPLSLLLIDIDLFKQYNDTFGHLAGDSALQSVARVLLSSLRSYDFLARYGGEEFVIILPATDLPDAIVVAERVRRLVAGSEFPHRKFTISIGAARLDANAGLKALVQAADKGLYEAKTNGRNRVSAGKAVGMLAAE